IGSDELNAAHTLVNHMLYRIASSAADADDLDDGTPSSYIQHIDFHDDSCLNAICGHQSSRDGKTGNRELRLLLLSSLRLKNQKLPKNHSFIRFQIAFTDPSCRVTTCPRKYCR